MCENCIEVKLANALMEFEKRYNISNENENENEK